MARREAVTVEGMDELAKKVDKLKAQVVEGLQRSVKDETDDVRDDMTRGAPRDTGELAESMRSRISNGGLTGEAAATARHAIFVNEGTADTPEQPFATAAAERSRQRFPKRVRAEVGAELDRLTR